MDWRGRFESMVNGLKTDKRFVVHEHLLGEPAKDQDISQAETSVKSALPDGVVDFYQQIGSFRLQWQASIDNDSQIKGSINILPIHQVLGNWNGATWSPGDDRYQPVKPFDLFTSEACAALYFPRPTTASTVHFHYIGEALADTHHTFTEYMERLLVSRGFWYWIQALSTETTDNPEAVSFREKGPLLFDDYRPDLFQPR